MSRFVMVAAATLVVAGCAEQAPPTSPMSIPIYVDAAGAGHAGDEELGTRLSGDEEVMPAGVENVSRAHGKASFRLSADGQSLEYKLIVNDISNAFMAHIHRARRGANGGIVVWLYPSTTPNQRNPVGGGHLSGLIAKGTIRSSDVVGSLAIGGLAALVAEIEAGNTYVNVHTDDGVAPTNTGPGDYPGGELRGQIAPRGN